MRIRDLKALARETLVRWYGSVIAARFFRSTLVWLSLAAGLVFLFFGLLNVGLFENWLWIILPDFVPSALAAIFFIMLALGSLAFTVLLETWLTFGYEKMLLNICRGRGKGSGEILSAFRGEARPWKVLWVGVVRLALIAAAALVPLFINGCAIACGYNSMTAGPLDIWRIVIRTTQILAVMWMIYLSLGFTFATTIVIDKPETGVIEALNISLKEITCNRKPKLFWLMSFSFFFWLLLAAAVPFATLFVMPYIEVTLLLYYLDGLDEISELPAYAELQKNACTEAEAADTGKEAGIEAAETETAPAGETSGTAADGTVNAAEGQAPAEAQAAAAAAAAADAPAETEESADSSAAAPASGEEEKPAEMGAIPRKIVFPDITADPDAGISDAPQETVPAAGVSGAPQAPVQDAGTADMPQAPVQEAVSGTPQQADVKDNMNPAQTGTEV